MLRLLSLPCFPRARIAALLLPLGTALALSLTALSVEAQARQDEQAQFGVSLRGIGVGQLSFSAVTEGGRYAVSGKLESTGFVGWLRKFSYTAQASGSVKGNQLIPARYSEDADTGKRQSTSKMEFSGGVPVKVENTPPQAPRPDDVKLSSMRGAIDPVSSLYASLRDVAPGQECKSSVKMFDGRRATEIVLSNPKKQGDKVVCTGEYRRLAGFSAKDMAEKTRFPFTLTYSPTAEGKMRVTEVTTDTIYGQAVMKRR